VQRVQQASRPEGLSWLHGSYEGVNVQLRRGTEGEICLVELDAAAIESKQTAGLVQLLRAMVSEAAPIKRSRGLVSMFTSAFDHDHRSVEDIPRMQAFVADVVAQCPWWMHVMWGEDVEMDNTKWWVVSMTQRLKPTEYGRDGSARMHVDTHSMRAVMMAGLQGCAHLYERACEKGWMSESEGGEMLDDVSAQVLAWKARLVGDSAG